MVSMIRRLMPALQADADLQILFLRFFGGGQNLADAAGVGGDRLFHEHVLAGLHRGLEMDRAEARRRGEQHHVDARIDRFLISVEADELLVFRHVDPIFERSLQASVTSVQTISERVGHGDQLHGSFGAQGLTAGAGAASAAADQSDFDGVIAGGMRRSCDAQRAGHGAGGCRHARGLEKIAPGRGRGGVCGSAGLDRGSS